MIEHKSPISGVAAHGGRLVATAGYDNQVILWDHARSEAIARASHDHLANQLAFSPDGRLLVSASSDHTARLWSVPDMKLLAVMGGHADDVEMAVFSPCGRHVATASRDHHVRVHDLAGGLVRRFSGHAADVISVSWSAGGDELVSSSDDGTVKRWSLAQGRLVQDHDLGGAETDTVAVGADGTLYAGNDDGEVVVLTAGRAGGRRLHDAGIKRLVLDDATRRLVSLAYDRVLRVSAVADGDVRPLAAASLPAEVWPRSCAFLTPGKLVFGTFGSRYAVYDIDAASWHLDGVAPTGGINALAVRDGRRLTVGDSGTVRIDGRAHRELGSLCNFLLPAGERVLAGGQLGIVFDALGGETLHQHRSPINCGAAFARGGVAHAVVGTYTGEGLVFRLAPGARPELLATLPLHRNAIKGVAVSRGVIFSVCADGGASWFSVDDLAEIARRGNAHERIANGCAALPDGRFASVSRDRQLRLWRGDAAEAIDSPHTHSIKCVAASADGRFVATGSYHGEVIVRDVVHERWQAVRRVSACGISSLAFDAAVGGFVAASYDGVLHDVPVGDARDGGR